jgi:hypothetical protein
MLNRWTAFVTDVPGDGKCMYHAIGLPLKIKGHVLNYLVIHFIEHNPDTLLHGQSIKNWIYWDENVSTKTYIHKLKQGQWGGALEATILASLFNVPIFVYSPKNKFCKRILECRPDTSILPINVNVPKFICILYTGNHYMSIDAIPSI